MFTYAVIEKNIVVNVIVADTLEIAQEVTGKTCVEYNEDNPAGIGWKYKDGVFTAPVSE
jgi:hypothetical protein